jgi:hypothetical protein
MPFIPALGVIKVEIQFTKSGQQCENVFYVDSTTMQASDALEDIADLVDAWVHSDYLPILPNEVTFVGTKCTDMTTSTSPAFFKAATGAITGTGGAGMPNNVTIAVHKTSAGRGRSASGRVYPIGVPTQHQSGVNNIAQVAATEFCVAFRALRDDVNASTLGGMFLTLVSFFTANAPRATGVMFHIVDFVCRDLVLDSQRRRLPGRGN